MGKHGRTLGIDFGTSNSAAGYMVDGAPRLIELEPGEKTLPTTFFFDFDTRETLIGAPAVRALLDGSEGRFMRALKRVLGTSLMHEPRQILNERVTFVDVVGRFLSEIKARAERATGERFDRAISGRPVVFHGVGDEREGRAQDDLTACYIAAGFDTVDFLPEPEAAAIAAGALDRTGEFGLIVDIGGGTSDFSVFRAERKGVSILANHGVRIGGTDFDRSISIARVMPLLGMGSELRKEMGAGTTAMPNGVFTDLATWEKIPFLYTPQKRRLVKDLLRLAEEPHKLQRLETVLVNELGHDLAFAVEQGKISANSGDSRAAIRLDSVEQGLAEALAPDDLGCILQNYSVLLRSGVRETLARAEIIEAEVSEIIYVGGSSMMGMVSDAMASVFPDARHRYSEVFTAVADGLAIAAAASDFRR